MWSRLPLVLSDIRESPSFPILGLVGVTRQQQQTVNYNYLKKKIQTVQAKELKQARTSITKLSTTLLILSFSIKWNVLIFYY